MYDPKFSIPVKAICYDADWMQELLGEEMPMGNNGVKQTMAEPMVGLAVLANLGMVDSPGNIPENELQARDNM